MINERLSWPREITEAARGGGREQLMREVPSARTLLRCRDNAAAPAAARPPGLAEGPRGELGVLGGFGGGRVSPGSSGLRAAGAERGRLPPRREILQRPGAPRIFNNSRNETFETGPCKLLAGV